MEKMSSAVAASQQDGLQREALESRIQLLEAELEKEREKSRQSVAKMEEVSEILLFLNKKEHSRYALTDDSFIVNYDKRGGS